MSDLSAHDVAAELRRRLDSPGDVQVHKLLYYCQGWHLARTGRPLFTERIEAWANGPVVAGLWRSERRGGTTATAQTLDEDALGTVQAVLSRYGKFTGKQLIRLTHTERPWVDASENAPDPDWNNSEITHEALANYFSQEEIGDLVRLARAAHADPLIEQSFKEGAHQVDAGRPDDVEEIRRRLERLRV